MKCPWSIAVLAALAPIPATAQLSRTVQIDRRRVDITRTLTHDGRGSISRESIRVRERDGATATREYARSFTGNGWSANGSGTDFSGRTRSFDASGPRGTFPRARRFKRR